MTESAFLQSIRQRDLSGGYYLFGEEEYRLRAALKKAKDMLEQATVDLNWQKLKHPSFQQIVEACEQLPFFDEKRIVVAEELDAETAEPVKEYFGRVPKSTVLLIVDPGKTKKSLSASMEKAGRSVAFPRMEEYRAADLIMEKVRQAGGEMDQGAARELVDRLGNDLYFLVNAARQMMAYAGPGNKVTVEDVRRCFPPSAEETVFSVLDSLIAGKKKKALTGLSELFRDKVQTPMGMSFFFVGRLEQMLTAKQLLEAGKKEPEIIRILGGSPYAAGKTIANAKRCSERKLCTALKEISEVPYLQISGTMQDGDALLMALIRNF